MPDDLVCDHGFAYPREGPAGPWLCDAQGGNPDCPLCQGGQTRPDPWAAVIVAVTANKEEDSPCPNKE